LAHEPIVTGVC